MDWDGPIGRRLRERLETERLVWLTTVGADGTPHPSLVWFWWDGREVLVYSQDRTPKLRNIERRPAVALNFNSNETGGAVGIITGTAEIDRSLPPAHLHPQYLAKYGDRISGMGMSHEEFSASYSVPILVQPASGRAL